VIGGRADGLPSDIAPIDNAIPGGMHQEPRIQANVACCAVLRSTPLLSTLQGITEPTAVIHGQRRADRVQAMGMSGWPLPEHVEVSAPLVDWSTEEVMGFLAAENVALPEHYAEITDSLDCWACTASFAEDKGPARAAYMRKAYPQLLDVVLPSVRRIRDAIRSPIDRLDLAIARAGPDQGTDPTFVLQWAPHVDDCIVAALATVIGRTYAETAAVLGVALDPVTGQPHALKGKGITMLSIGGSLLSIGLTGTFILSTAGGGLLDPADMRRHLAGRRAVLAAEALPVGVSADYEGPRELHALAWTGTRLFDCRGPEVQELDIDEVVIVGATIVTEMHAPGRRLAG
jgi:hypothetical protein